MDTWTCYRLTSQANLADWQWEDLANRLFELGADGTEIKDDSLLAYFAKGKTPKDFQQQINKLSLEIANTQEIEDKNWTAMCKEMFEPVTINKIKVEPTTNYSERNSAPDTINLIPGMGFGSGHHPTSQMLIKLLQELPDQPENLQVLDFGTGSGILSVAAAKLLPSSQILAIDNDPQALLNAKDNLKINSNYQEQITFSDQDVNELEDSYDLILANIYLEVLKGHRDQLKKLLKHDGTLLISGITDNQVEELRNYFSKEFKIIKTLNDSDWNALSLSYT